MDLLKKLCQHNIIKHGDFTLKSGKKSDIYIDLRTIISIPELLSDISLLYHKKCNQFTNDDLVCGVPLGAIPITTLISQSMKKPMIMLRKESKKHGLGKLVEGNFEIGQTCTLIEDVTTTGSSIEEARLKLQEHGIIVNNVVVFVDRREKNEPFYHSIFHLPLTQNPLEECIIRKKSNLCVALDLTSSADIIEKINIIGPYVCMIKLHSDIIVDFNYKFISELKKKYDFLIMDDRKFSDIGNTLKLQLSNSYYNHKEWCDCVTVQCLPGEGILKTCRDHKMGVFSIVDMSTKGNLYNEIYKDQVIDLINRNSDVVWGAITQKTIPGILCATPGIHLTSKEDSSNQTYRTPEEAKADVIIVGRDIYESENIRQKVELYHNEGWRWY